LENNKKDLINWALEKFKSNIVLNEQCWGFFPTQPYYDYRTLIKINEVEYAGRGISGSQKQAITSSIAEALERYALNGNEHKYSSSGCAIHSNKELAILNSRQELLERHYAMLFSLGYCNETTVTFKETSAKVNMLVEHLENKKIKVIFYKLFSSLNEFVVLCLISGLESSPKFGATFGASCKNNLEESIEASFCEALPNVMAFLKGDIQSLTFEEFKKIAKPKPIDHLNLYLNNEYAAGYFSKRVIKPFLDSYINPDLFATEEIDYFYSQPYPVMRSTHPHCINARWGLLPESFVPDNLNPFFPLVLP
jgi:hypothetical protein